MRHVAIALLLVAVLAAPGRACPTCSEGIRAQVRAEVFGEDFGRNLLVTAWPFAVFLGITAAIHGRPARRGGHDDEA